MQDSAKELAAFVAKVRGSTGAAKVDLIGHSQGTLMPNYYVKFMRRREVRQALHLPGSAVARHRIC